MIRSGRREGCKRVPAFINRKQKQDGKQEIHRTDRKRQKEIYADEHRTEMNYDGSRLNR